MGSGRARCRRAPWTGGSLGGGGPDRQSRPAGGRAVGLSPAPSSFPRWRARLRSAAMIIASMSCRGVRQTPGSGLPQLSTCRIARVRRWAPATPRSPARPFLSLWESVCWNEQAGPYSRPPQKSVSPSPPVPEAAAACRRGAHACGAACGVPTAQLPPAAATGVRAACRRCPSRCRSLAASTMLAAAGACMDGGRGGGHAIRMRWHPHGMQPQAAVDTAAIAAAHSRPLALPHPRVRLDRRTLSAWQRRQAQARALHRLAAPIRWVRRVFLGLLASSHLTASNSAV